MAEPGGTGPRRTDAEGADAEGADRRRRTPLVARRGAALDAAGAADAGVVRKRRRPGRRPPQVSAQAAAPSPARLRMGIRR